MGEENELYTVKILPRGLEVKATKGEKLSAVLVRVLKNFPLPCGGRGFCGKCVIKVVSGDAGPLTGNELLHGIKPPNRLACQARVFSDLVIEVKEEERSIKAVAPGVEPVVELQPIVDVAKLSPRVGHEPLDSVVDKVLPASSEIPLYALSKLCWLVEEHRAEKIYALMAGTKVIDFRVAEPSHGFAVDLGTTKIAFYLVNLKNGVTILEDYVLNPQAAYGDDVISRIYWAMKDKRFLEDMRQRTLEAVNQKIAEMVERAGLKLDQIGAMVLVGNTVMTSIFLGIPVSSLGRAPYVPPIVGSVQATCNDVGVEVLGNALFYIPPGLAGFVGADAVADIITALHLGAAHEQPALIIDLGTNTEIVLIHNDEIWAASAPAGPAIEGAHISCGTKALEGAVTELRVTAENKVEIVFTGEKPIGLTGSAIISLIAGLLRNKVVTPSGKLTGKYWEMKYFPLGHNLKLTQKDIREFQKAKAAVAATWKLLLAEAGLMPSELKRLYVCGSFGSSIPPADAIQVGLLPNIPLKRIFVLGNAAGTGARLILKSRKAQKLAEELPEKAKVRVYASRKVFQEAWINSLSLSPYPSSPSEQA